MGLTLRQVDQMPIREFNRWIAYNRIEPFGEKRDDLRMAIICQNVIRAMTGKVIEVDKFMPNFESRNMTPKQIDAIRRNLEAKGRVKRG